MCAILYFFLIVCNKPHANPTIIYENIKEIHILAVRGTLEFPILSHMLLRRVLCFVLIYTRPIYQVRVYRTIGPLVKPLLAEHAEQDYFVLSVEIS